MGVTMTYRSTFSRALAGVTVALCVLLLGWLVLDEGVSSVRYAPALLLLGLLAWQAYWRPQVEVSDGGVEIRNVWRTVHVPWPAVQDVDGKLGLRLVTAYGAHQAWAVPAPRRTSRRATVQEELPATSEAATLVRDRWEELRAAGYLDDPRLERPEARTRMHWLPLVAALVLLALSVGVVLAG